MQYLQKGATWSAQDAGLDNIVEPERQEGFPRNSSSGAGLSCDREVKLTLASQVPPLLPGEESLDVAGGL